MEKISHITTLYGSTNANYAINLILSHVVRKKNGTKTVFIKKNVIRRYLLLPSCCRPFNNSSK